MSIENQPSLDRKLILQRSAVDGQDIKELVAAGMTWLNTNKQTVNALNVFPVPDGDTGTNMMLTMQSAFDEIKDSPEVHAGKMFGAVAQGALMGARGNSGVILSQVWRGIASAMKAESALNGKNLVASLSSARDTAYKGVVRPVEGTILTVVKDVAAATEKALDRTDDPVELLEIAVEAAAASVERTPDLLPVLKEAGVVDSGGKGFFFLLEGMVRWINNQPLDIPLAEVQPLDALRLDNTLAEIEEGQDYEVVVDFRPKNVLDLESFYAGLEEIGTSIQVGEGEGMYRMHIHVPTENRYTPIDYCMQLGTVTNVAIENLIAQMEAIENRAGARIELTPLQPGQIATVAVAPGPGIARVFASLGVAALVEGGQTMNPSTQDIMAAFENLPTNQVIILPNNKNIILAAETAAELTVKEVHVVKSKTVPQGLAAMMRLAPDGDFKKVAEEMEQALDEVQTGEITTATRTVEIDGVKVKEGQIIGLLNGKLIVAAPALEQACLSLLKKIDMDNYELITMFYGNNVKSDQVEKIASAIQDQYPHHEVEIQAGEQPHYQFIFSIE
ncbi:MAG: DAK2 domain-containing protein [Anaerolineales bacterium]|nr:DAK2 domain-containing protein [Anaerolineales bacterium]